MKALPIIRQCLWHGGSINALILNLASERVPGWNPVRLCCCCTITLRIKQRYGVCFDPFHPAQKVVHGGGWDVQLNSQKCTFGCGVSLEGNFFWRQPDFLATSLAGYVFCCCCLYRLCSCVWREQRSWTAPATAAATASHSRPFVCQTAWRDYSHLHLHFQALLSLHPSPATLDSPTNPATQCPANQKGETSMHS